MIQSTLKKSLKSQTKKIPYLLTRFSSIYKKTYKDPFPEKISEDKSSLDPNLLKEHIHKTNYNFEENPDYKSRVESAKNKRNMIKELKEKSEVKRVEKYTYDRPRHDKDISNYSVWREFSDSTITKEYPHEYPVMIKIEISPKDMIHVFGDAVVNNRNDNYSTKEWDFVDSNLDRFLVYDFKATTEYWGDNLSEEWYEVRLP